MIHALYWTNYRGKIEFRFYSIKYQHAYGNRKMCSFIVFSSLRMRELCVSLNSTQCSYRQYVI